MNKKKWILIGGVSLCLLFVGFGIYNFRVKSRQTSNTNSSGKGIPLQCEKATLSPLKSSITVNGYLKSEKEEKLYTKQPQKLINVLKKSGDYVEKGEIILEFDPESFNTANNQLKKAIINLDIQKETLNNITPTSAEQKQAKSNLNNLTIALEQNEAQSKDLTNQYKNLLNSIEDNEKLFNEGAISEQNVDALRDQKLKLENQLKIIKQQIDASKLQVSLAKDQYNSLISPDPESKISKQRSIQEKQIELQELQILDLKQRLEDSPKEVAAPISGTILYINSEEGSFTSPNSPVVAIGDLERLQIKLGISEYDASHVNVDQKVIITSDALMGKTFEGKVSHIDPAATEKRVANGIEKVFMTDIAVLSKDKSLKPGFSVECEIITHDISSTLICPIVAVLRDKDGKSFVYIINKEGLIEKRNVQTGITSDLYVQILEGLEDGDIIITQLGGNVKAGLAAKPIFIEEAGE